ncbi:hypothetical protein HID58_006696, partial [Brassica napus]
RYSDGHAFDAVMLFAAVDYVGENTFYPLKYSSHSFTYSFFLLQEFLWLDNKVKKLIYSSTCATYGGLNKCRLLKILRRYFNVIGSDPGPGGILGEAPRPELREQGLICGACFDAAPGTDYKTSDGTCIRDYIDVTGLVDAHPPKVPAFLTFSLEKKRNSRFQYLQVQFDITLTVLWFGETGRSGKEFVEACKKATGVEIKVDFLPSDPTKILGDLNWTARFTNLQDSLQIHPSSWLCFLLKTEETTTN